MIFFDTVSAIDRLQNKFVSFNSNVFMILEVLARLLGISADIKIAMHYKQYGNPANEFSGLDLNAFLMNDLNPLTYGYLSPLPSPVAEGPAPRSSQQRLSFLTWTEQGSITQSVLSRLLSESVSMAS